MNESRAEARGPVGMLMTRSSGRMFVFEVGADADEEVGWIRGEGFWI